MKIHIIIGTRPEAIKMAPVIKGLSHFPKISTTLIGTGQHADLLEGMLASFGLSMDLHWPYSLGRTQHELLSELLLRCANFWKENPADLVLVQGDTTSAWGAAQAAVLLGIPVGHVEAGLRTYRMDAPFPEELNRQWISRCASLHFAPTKRAFDTLKEERVQGEIHLVGNTVVDALEEMLREAKPQQEKKYDILVTAHRRESFGGGIASIAHALSELSLNYRIAVIVHPNPQSKDVFEAHLSGNPKIDLLEPVPYEHMPHLLMATRLLLTDSGGLQEEAPSFALPVLVLRESTERQELIESGAGLLVGTSREKIVEESKAILDNEVRYTAMSKSVNPFGDGHSGIRIAEICHEWLFAQHKK